MSETPRKQDDRFAELFSRNQHRIYGFIYSLLPNYTDAEEILHQTTVVLWRKWDQLKSEDDFLRWSCGIARNEIRNYLRLHERRNEYLSDELIENLADTTEAIQPLLIDRKDALAHCVEQLDTGDRDLLAKCYSDDVPIRHVAKRLSLAPNALYKRLARLRRALYDCVQRRLGEEAGG